MRSTLRGTGILVVTAVCFAALLWVLARASRGTIATVPAVFDPAQVRAAEKLRDVNFDPDPAKLPSVIKEVAVTPQHESPILERLVKRGELPPLKDRMPEEPVVMEGPDGIGQYGGTWIRLANAEVDIGNTVNWRLSGAYLCRWSTLGYPIKPFIAKSVTHSADLKVWTITLRKGMRWSNGDPYSVDDVMYWWNDEVLNPYVDGGVPPEMMWSAGKLPTLERVDDYTFRVKFAAPYALFMERLCGELAIVGSPSKYLRQYHPDPKIGNAAVIARDMKGYKQASPRALYTFMRQWQNTDLPTMSPWTYKSYRSRPPQVIVRNPYFFAVDTAGNQLPYIDRMQFEVKEPPIMTIALANGAASMQDRNVDFSGYTELMTRRETSGTRILHWYPGTRQIWVININQNRMVKPEEPATKWKEKLLSDKRFRQALSVAINRRQIITAEYFGVGEPSQVSPGPMSPFDNPDLAKKYAEYDPAHANKLLDDLGLTQRDYEGYRTFPDGSRMTFFIDYTQFTGEGPMQFVLDNWKAAGVRVMRRMCNRPLFYAYWQPGDFDFNVWSSESDIHPLITPRHFISHDGQYAPAWCRWYDRGGFYGSDKANVAGCVNPKDSVNGLPMYHAIEFYEQALRTQDLSEQVRLFRKIHEIAAENVWSIGIATAPPTLVVIDKKLKNVPERALIGATYSNPSNTGIETYFFDKPPANPSADAETEYAMVHPTNRPGAAAVSDTTMAARLVRYLIIGILLAGGAMLCLRHPFVLRRFVILVPTLLVISVIVFTIVQLPPGDFLTNRRSQLLAINSPNVDQQIADLEQQFHTADPAWKNYMRWTGVLWFSSFAPSDEGLLQGNLGRSMENGLPVNDLIGDRITLTVLLSLGTVLFTWLLALPIGIYSAVRQYTPSDYALTLLGFFGMSVPAFLLALVLMAASGFTGLYSPEFATQPGWSLGKAVDLSKHLWIPVLVLAVGGTAGMIRVMRANLLDELRKPYVVTARAKGVRPLRLLVKYPVRVALNPFVSGIGNLFPALVSGGSIVAIVLSLPMVGPMLLNALFSQDAYLAGSMLMVLSLLGVLGTLVSDLLLLWLDPRIRLESGSR
jgi:ABC-type dipeptide/oligopeptide/nickel transport system permease component/ABC-type transport system substrate-binding protein